MVIFNICIYILIYMRTMTIGSDKLRALRVLFAQLIFGQYKEDNMYFAYYFYIFCISENYKLKIEKLSIKKCLFKNFDVMYVSASKLI